MEAATVHSCRICGAPLERPPGDFPYHPSLSRCSACLTIQMNFAVKEQGALYPTFNKKSSPLLSMLQLPLKIFNYERLFFMRRGGIGIAKGSDKDLLDVGCGAGFFLRFVSSYFKPWGVEPFSFNPNVLPEMRNKIHFGPLTTLRRPDASLDVITFWQSLEHIEDPLPVLQKCHRLLKSDGRILISVPNICSWQSRVFVDRWAHLTILRHVFQFERSTLHALLSRAGFSPVLTATFTFEYGLSGWAQSFLNSLFDKDLLYEWLKARGEFEKQPGRFNTAKALVSLSLALLLTPLFALLEILAGLMAGGTVLNVVAIKRRQEDEAQT